MGLKVRTKGRGWVSNSLFPDHSNELELLGEIDEEELRVNGNTHWASHGGKKYYVALNCPGHMWEVVPVKEEVEEQWD